MVCFVNDQRSSVVFEVAYKYCISDSFVDYDAHSISSKGFLPTGAMLSEFLFQFSVGLCSLLVVVLWPNHGGGSKDNGNLLQRSHACTAALSAPNPASGHCQPTSPLPETPGHAQASLGQSPVWSLLLSPGS